MEKEENKTRENALGGNLLVFFSVVALPMFARTILVQTQPVSPYADTEVSTNVVIQTGRTDVRDVKIRLQLDGKIGRAHV